MKFEIRTAEIDGHIFLHKHDMVIMLLQAAAEAKQELTREMFKEVAAAVKNLQCR